MLLLERHGPHGHARDEPGLEVDLDADLPPTGTALASLADPARKSGGETLIEGLTVAGDYRDEE